MVALTEYVKQKDDTIWTIGYDETEVQPEPLPIILLNVAGISSALVTPYTISMKKKTDESSRTIDFCAPDFFSPDCWGNTEDALVCSDDPDKQWYRNSTEFNWGVCRREPNMSRLLCPRSDPIMCANLKANMGIEPVCDRHENCAIAFFGGPRVCRDGRNLGSVYENPTSCDIVSIPDERGYENVVFDLKENPQIFRFQTFLIIIPPNATLSHTREEYYLSFRLMLDSSELNSDIEMEYGLRFMSTDADTLKDNGAVNWVEIVNHFYGYPDALIHDMPPGSKSTMMINPQTSTPLDGPSVKKSIVTTTMQPFNYLWYHSAIITKLSSNRVTINEEKRGLDWMSGFIGPAGGFICLLLQIQGAILFVVLSGIYIPCPTGGGRRFFGWKVNTFDADFRTRMVLYNNIYQPDVADQAEGRDMLEARTVTWPSNDPFVETQSSKYNLPMDLN